MKMGKAYSSNQGTWLACICCSPCRQTYHLAKFSRVCTLCFLFYFLASLSAPTNPPSAKPALTRRSRHTLHTKCRFAQPWNSNICNECGSNCLTLRLAACPRSVVRLTPLLWGGDVPAAAP